MRSICHNDGPHKCILVSWISVARLLVISEVSRCTAYLILSSALIKGSMSPGVSLLASRFIWTVGECGTSRKLVC